MPENYEMCEGCGKSFRKRRRNQKFCDDSCRNRAWMEGRIRVRISDLPAHLRQQIATWRAAREKAG